MHRILFFYLFIYGFNILGNFSHSKKAESKNVMDYEELKELLNNKQHSVEIHSDGSGIV